MPSSSSSIEQEAGTIAGQYSCVYEGVSGVLYAGTKALYFVGTFFLFDKKLKLRWESIRQVVKLDQGGIQIWMKSASSGNGTHTFTAMHQPARVWPVLVSLHNDTLLDYRGGGAATSTTTSASHPSTLHPTHNANEQPPPPLLLKRRNSDPTAMMVLPSSSEDQMTFEESGSKSNPAAAIEGGKRGGLFSVQGLSKDEIGIQLGDLRMPPLACTYDNVRGTLYGGTKGLYFYGSKGWFAWDIRRLQFPFGTVRQIQILHEKQGIRIILKQAPSSTGGATATTTSGYEFVEMENPDKVWASLIKLQNDILTERYHLHARQRAESGGDLRNSFVRTNSDPEMRGGTTTSTASSHHDNHHHENNHHPPPPKEISNNNNNNTRPTSSFSGATTTELMEPSKPRMVLNREESMPLSPPTPATTVTVAEQSSLAAAVEMAVDLEREWNHAVSKKSNYPHLIVENFSLNCSLDQFYDCFLKDDAPYSIAKYLESRGDSAVRTSEWKPHPPPPAAAANGNNSWIPPSALKRVIHYKHPVNAPLAPPKAGARKEQRLLQYGTYGLLVETATIVDDVPMADCFRVDDRIRVQAISPKIVQVSMEFQITFVKSTMFKSIISKTTKMEFSDFFGKMASFMSCALGGSDAPAAVVPGTTSSQPKQMLWWNTTALLSGWQLPSSTRLAFLLVLAFQWYIAWELHTMKQDMMNVAWMQQQQHSSGLCKCPPMVITTTTIQEAEYNSYMDANAAAAMQ